MERDRKAPRIAAVRSNTILVCGECELSACAITEQESAMKTMAIIITLSLFATLPIAAQRRDSNAQVKQRTEKRFEMMDEDGDGIRDRSMKKKMDRFIDANGDGICDSRERGLGFRRGQAATEKQKGKKLQGGKK